MHPTFALPLAASRSPLRPRPARRDLSSPPTAARPVPRRRVGRRQGSSSSSAARGSTPSRWSRASRWPRRRGCPDGTLRGPTPRSWPRRSRALRAGRRAGGARRRRELHPLRGPPHLTHRYPNPNCRRSTGRGTSARRSRPAAAGGRRGGGHCCRLKLPAGPRPRRRGLARLDRVPRGCTGPSRRGRRDGAGGLLATTSRSPTAAVLTVRTEPTARQGLRFGYCAGTSTSRRRRGAGRSWSEFGASAAPFTFPTRPCSRVPRRHGRAAARPQALARHPGVGQSRCSATTGTSPPSSPPRVRTAARARSSPTSPSRLAPGRATRSRASARPAGPAQRHRLRGSVAAVAAARAPLADLEARPLPPRRPRARAAPASRGGRASRAPRQVRSKSRGSGQRSGGGRRARAGWEQPPKRLPPVETIGCPTGC
jgi:hypothetical protein